MTLEATMLVLDNSDWMRNGDYTPSRVDAQADAVNLLFQAKQQSHPENTVGIMTMAGKEPEVLVTLTSDVGKILNALHRTTISGQANLSTGIQVAQLALKYRRNRNQRQRIIAFVGSPIEEDEASLVRLAKKLKKNNVAVDIISFGETSVNDGKLESFINNINSGDNSHLVTIPPGPHLLSDALLSSPIISSGGGGGGGGNVYGRGNNDFDFGMNPEDDPELAMALRISLQEEEARQAAAAASSGTAATDNPSQSAEASTSAPAAAAAEDTVMEDLTEDEQIARAIAMSLENGNEEADQSAFVDSVLSGLTGVHPPTDSTEQNNSSKSEGGNGENKPDEQK